MFRGNFRQLVLRRASFIRGTRHNSTSPLLNKYADRVQQKLQEEGAKDLKELKEKLKTSGKAHAEPQGVIPPVSQQSAASQSTKPNGPLNPPEPRKDGSPVKPLSTFLNVSAILKTPHTAEQISALWTVYHASRSNNTGRGYVSATIPVQTYEAMLERARKWPMFVLPVPHPDEQHQQVAKGEAQVPVEFHFLQWGFYPPPLIPSPASETEHFPMPSQPRNTTTEANPPVTTAIFTPLVQYKLHQSYAPPYFIMTHYTDLARSHGIVLLRGEITPSSAMSVNAQNSSGDGRYTLSQRDAQVLALGVQQFYLPAIGNDEKSKLRGEEAQDLLVKFHEKPAEFEWEKLLKFTDAGLLS